MNPVKTGRVAYAIALVVYGIQQLIYADFRPVFFPPWQHSLPWLPLWSYAFGVALLIAAASIMTGKRAKETFLIVGVVFLGLVCLAHVPYQLISQPNKPYHLGIWGDALKELAFAGGALVMAGSYSNQTSRIFPSLEQLIPYGSIFFSITMVAFGVAHCMYPDGIATMVPAYFPDKLFWTYFAALALIGSGVFIVLNIRRRLIAILQSLMIFLWFLLLHLPSAVGNPYVQRGNQLASAFDALLFSGVALVIAFGMPYQAGDDIK